MHGYVAEWCADGPWEYPQDGGEQMDPAGAARNGENMVRGGSWKSDAAGIRSASREKHGWRTKEEDIGFRVALVPALDRDFPYAEEEGEWKRMEFAWCPPGSFTMGSPADEEGREPVSEGAEGRKGGKEPQREVTLTHGFWMGKHEVTRKQYAGVVGGEAGDEPDLPAVSVSWADATNYAYRLTAVAEEAGALPEGWEFALPTEAQWEYACRALTTNALNNGEELEGGDASEVLEEVGWYQGNSQGGGDERHLHAVGELRLVNIVFFAFVFLTVGNLFYWLGWLARRFPSRPALRGGKTARALLALALAALALIGVGTWVRDGGRVSSAAAIGLLRSGEGREYRACADRRLAVLEDPQIRDAKLEPFPVQPWLLYYTDIAEDPDEWVNVSMAAYYGKDSVSFPGY